MNNNSRKKEMALFIGAVSLALSVMTNAEQAKSIKYGTASSHGHFFTLMELPL